MPRIQEAYRKPFGETYAFPCHPVLCRKRLGIVQGQGQGGQWSGMLLLVDGTK